jgi:hypothetical protein
MRRGERKMLSTVPHMIASIEKRLSPSKRSCMLSMRELHIQGAPRRMMPMKDLA